MVPNHSVSAIGTIATISPARGRHSTRMQARPSTICAIGETAVCQPSLCHVRRVLNAPYNTIAATM